LIDQVRFICSRRVMYLVLLIVSLDKIFDDAVRFPEGEIVVIVVDDGWDASIRVMLDMFRSLHADLWVIPKLKVLSLVLDTEFLKDDGDFPTIRS